MENIKIKEFRKFMRLEKGKDGIFRERSRPYTTFQCFGCNKVIDMASSCYKPNKPCNDCLKRLRGKQNFFNKAKEKFGDLFDLSKAELEYYDAITPVTVKCNKHGNEYKVSPTRFVAKPYPNQPGKGGCPECAREINVAKNKKSIDYYLAIIENTYPDIEVISHGTAESNLEVINLNCPIHGAFQKTLAKVLQSTGVSSKLCDCCTNEQHAWRTRMARIDIPGLVYFVKFNDVSLYKCGVTYRTTEKQLQGHLKNIEILWELPFNTLADAYFFEFMFFREYRHIRCKHPDATLGGYTEFFSEFIQKPLLPFVEEILRRKESNSEELLSDTTEDNSKPSLKHEEGQTTISQESTPKWVETVPVLPSNVED